jgi:hypothetical protein
MDRNYEYASNTVGKEAATRLGTFAKRRNPMPEDPPENDSVAKTSATPLHVDQPSSSDEVESQIDQHRQLEWAATLRSYRNTKLLLNTLNEVTPRGTLTLVRKN